MLEIGFVGWDYGFWGVLHGVMVTQIVFGVDLFGLEASFFGLHLTTGCWVQIIGCWALGNWLWVLSVEYNMLLYVTFLVLEHYCLFFI